MYEIKLNLVSCISGQTPWQAETFEQQCMFFSLWLLSPCRYRLYTAFTNVPGGPGSPVCSKRSVPWNFSHKFPCFQDPLRLVIFFLRSIMISVTSRGSDKPACHGGAKVSYGCPRSITIISTPYYGLLRSFAGQLRFDQGVTRFFVLSRSATDET